MALREEFEKHGNWLFRWRSYLPLFLLPLVALALLESIKSSCSFGYPIDNIYLIFCIIISFAGLLIRALTIGYIPRGTSGANTKAQKANTLNITGIYSIVRHPLYLGNFIIFLGFILFFKVWWFVIIAILLFWLYYERIMFREEEFLREKFGETYLSWSNKTPAFIPRLKTWQPSDLPFSLWKIVKRDYRGFFEIIASFTLVAFVQDYLENGKYIFNLNWTIFFSIGLFFFIIIRIIKKILKIKRT